MKQLFKRIILLIFQIKCSYCLKNNSCFKIAVVGGKNRKIYKEEIACALRDTGYTVLENKSGYNYKLGLILTLLKRKAGSNSILFWLTNIFSSCKFVAEDIVVNEFAFTTKEDFKWLLKYYKINALVLAHDTNDNLSKIVSHNIPINILTITPNKLINLTNQVVYGQQNDCDIEITNISENNVTEFKYKINNVSYNKILNKFGIHYIYPRVISHFFILNSLKKDANKQ